MEIKKLYTLILAGLLLLSASQLTAKNDNPVSRRITIGRSSTILKSSVTGDLLCPENTIHSEAFDPNARMKGINRSDQGYVNGKTRDYQTFSDNRFLIHGVQVFGIFADGSFQLSTERLHLDSEGNMLEPIRLEVAFWEIAPTGLPGNLIYREEIDVIGEKTGATWGVEGREPVGPIYAFKMNLKEKVRMESGFVSVCAVDMGDHPQSSFCTIHDSSISHPGLISYEQEGQPIKWFNGGFNYCFLGSQNEPLAQKGLKFTRILSPSQTERGKFAKVQVELRNYGTTDISDAMLELYENERLLHTETVDATIRQGDTYKYTFKNRIDCSDIGTHHYTLRNITPGDELFAPQTITFSTTNIEDVCSSQSLYDKKYKYIKRVTVGTIDNPSEWSQYSDFRNLKTEIKPSEKLTMTIDRIAGNGYFVKVWVDWNGNGLFDDVGEFIGYVTQNTIDIKIPEEIYAEPGDKCMRIVLSNTDTAPCGNYYYGETEDYTLTVVRPAFTPALSLGSKELDVEMNVGETSEHTLNMKNDGSETLHANISVLYRLPFSPDTRPVYKSPTCNPTQTQKPVLSVGRQGCQTVGYPKEPTEDTNIVLSYGGDYSSNVGADNVYVSFAQHFPGTALANISGMQLSSIDVYIASAARKSFVVVWKGRTQNTNGEPIVKQQFVPQPNSWNHIVLEHPVNIADQDLWIGVALEGCKGINYLVGVDRGPASIGFGDMISIENSNYWWSLADLGTDCNILIRGNVTGQRTPAVSWLNLDKEELTLAAGQNNNVKLHINTYGLKDNLYEASIKITTNDPLASLFKLPVYLRSKDSSDITMLKGIDTPMFSITPGRQLTSTSSKPISYMAIFDMCGTMLAIEYDARSIDISRLQQGIYIVKAVYKDNSSTSGKFMIK